MFLTLTLPSYGRVTAEGVPVDPERYDYRRAALDALHFPKLVDRFWQNLRRCAGYKVQYFATDRGAAPPRPAPPRRHPGRHPPQDRAQGPGRHLPPGLVARPRRCRCTRTGCPLVDRRRRLRRPDRAGCCRPGRKRSPPTTATPTPNPPTSCGSGTRTTSRACSPGRPTPTGTVGYLCKYLTKAIAGTYDDGDASRRPGRRTSTGWPRRCAGCPARPRAPTGCATASSPRTPEPGMVPGPLQHKAHDRANLGLGGRRVLVSRKWSGKTLADHKADRAAVVAGRPRGSRHRSRRPRRARPSRAPTAAGPGRCSAAPGSTRRTYTAAIAQAIATRERWRAEYEAAKAARAGPAPESALLRRSGSSAMEEGAGHERGSDGRAAGCCCARRRWRRCSGSGGQRCSS